MHVQAKLLHLLAMFNYLLIYVTIIVYELYHAHCHILIFLKAPMDLLVVGECKK